MSLFMFFLTVISGAAAAAANFSIQPLYFEFAQDPKVAEEPFSIKVNCDGEATLKVSLYESKQNIDGFLDFIEVKNGPAENQIIVKESSHRFLRAGTWEISGTVKYLKNVKDTRALALMVEEVKNQATGGVGVSVRYAVVFKIRNATTRVSEKAEVVFNNYFIENGGTFLKATINNLSDQDFDVQTIATIRDSDKKLVDTVTMESLASWKRKDHKTLVMPKTKIELLGKTEKIKSKSSYSVTIYSKLNGKKQLSATGNFKLNETLDSTEKAHNLILNPNKIAIITNAKKGGAFRFEMKNEFDENVEVVFEEGINRGALSLVQTFPNRLTIPKDAKRTAIFKVSPLDLSKSTKQLVVNAVVKNISGKILKTIEIPVELAND